MATININSIQRIKPIPNSRFTYSDLELDLKFKNTQSFPVQSTLKKKDIVADYDLGAIKNSIVNLFTTMPGEKLLNPSFGLNLNQFLFQPCNANTAQLMADLINRQILRFETRVKIDRLEVVALVSKQEYEITLGLQVPLLNNSTTLNIRGLLNSTGIEFYN
jgi:phage baseplate assembly protein W|tara:strand:+ start:301 stop:786 length:486 start_codon:yes stop_codon:yes gene_type:complete